jgi:hypothetical protein
MMQRKTFLQAIGFGSLGGLIGLAIPRPRFAGTAGPSASPAGGTSTMAKGETPPEESYSQAGEDRIVSFMYSYVNENEAMTYLDIGAYHPTSINNTYYFYKRGAKGVLVEPNASICKVLREVRPRDTVLEAGIGITAQREADYYMMTEPSWNTFSKEEAEHQEKITNKRIRIKEVIKMPLYDINQVIADHFGGQAPLYLSIDAEGIHFEILKSVDFSRFRPKIICIETLVSGTTKTIPEIEAFMKEKNYVARGATFVNTIFVDNEILQKIEAARKPG